MGQQQSGRFLSIRTRLLVGVVTLVILLVAFLNIFTIILINADKSAQAFRVNAVEAHLAGDQFKSLTGHVLDTLHLALSTPDTKRESPARLQARLQSLVDNQSDTVLLAVMTLNTHTGKLVGLAEARESKKEGELGFKTSADFALHPDKLQSLALELMKSSYVLLNLSKGEQLPYLGILLSDTSNAAQSVTIPVALAIAPLREFGMGISHANMTILTRSGRVLFDSSSNALTPGSEPARDPLFELALSRPGVESGQLDYTLHGERYLGSYFQPERNLIVLARTNWDLAMVTSQELMRKFFMLGLAAVLAAVLLVLYFSRVLVEPINKLVAATNEIANGNFALTLRETGQDDEIGQLTRAFNQMAAKVRELFKENVEKVLLESELDIAATVQQNLLPPPIYRSNEVTISSYYQAASRCGGDWWGFFRVRDKICVGIADATGHGLQCALVTATARSAFSILQMKAEQEVNYVFSPSKMLKYLNRAVFDSCDGKIMMTFFMAVIDLGSKSVTYANAGHNFPWIFRRTGAGYSLKSLTAFGNRLGERLNAADFEEETLTMEAEDTLFFYTDGLIEAPGLDGVAYGKKRMRAMLEMGLPGGAEKAMDFLLADFAKHTRGKFLDDDITLAIAKFTL